MHLQKLSPLCSALVRRCVRSYVVVALLLLTGVGIASAQQQTINVTGGGTLSYLVTSRQDFVCSSPSFYVREYDYTNFVYTDTTGTRFSLPYTATSLQVTGDNRDNCPPPPADKPIQMTGGGYVLSFTPSAGFGSATLNPSPLYLSPKFQVLAVTYAPPGAKSNVNYVNSTAQGTSTSSSKTFTDQTSLTVTLSTGLDTGVFNEQDSASLSTSYTNEKDSSTSVALNETKTYGRQVPGPASSALGIDHRYDIIWVWLNPISNMSINPNGSLNWLGYSYDGRDINEMDIVPLYVYWLQTPSTIPANVASILARTWDTTGPGGLTGADYATILARDPLVSTSFNPNTDATHRFDLQGGQTFSYQPPPPGGQPITQTYSLAYQNTTTAGQGASDTYSVGLTLDAKLNASAIIAKASVEIKVANTATWVNKWSTLSTATVGQTASMSVTGPATADNYTGPTRFQVFKDNVYGTFMFYPVN